MKILLVIIPIIMLANCNNAQSEYNPKSIELNNKAIIIMQQGMMSSRDEKETHYNKALNLFNEAIAIDSSFINPYDNKIIILVDLKKYPEAIDVLKLKLVRQQDLAEGYFFLGLLTEAIGDTVSAFELYNKSVGIFKERISQGKMIEANEINLASAYIMINEEEKGNLLIEKYLLDEKYSLLAEILYKKTREEILKELLQN